jgi:hypothetical protein
MHLMGSGDYSCGLITSRSLRRRVGFRRRPTDMPNHKQRQ